MVWTPVKDGYEQSYFREPNGPIYVQRKFVSGGCLFGDFPEKQAPNEKFVRCGEVWTGSFGQQLKCECKHQRQLQEAAENPHGRDGATP
jgi:hypothetical protein